MPRTAPSSTACSAARMGRLGALGAAAALALSACAGGSAGTASTTSAASGAATSSAASSAATSGSASGAVSGAASASTVELTAGTCLNAPSGVRDVHAMQVVDCEQEHTAEYLWAVPAAEAGASGSASASASAEAGIPAVDTEQACRAMAAVYGKGRDVALSATELRDSADQSQHCVVYSVTTPWKGQVVDPQVTLETAQEQAAS